jgi:NTP pyrophosphatase (non-canonical NTP hydrolase)
LPPKRHYLFIQAWQQQARQNVKEWGLQDRETLLLAMQEELGELTQATLEAEYEAGDYQDQFDELRDLAALLLQYQHKLESMAGEHRSTDQ